jgi:ATP-dependent DNA ligase
LESLNLAGGHWTTAPSFDDGAALWAVVERDELEGVVAKPLNGRYRPGERGWLKVKNRAYWKYELDAKPRSTGPANASLVFTAVETLFVALAVIGSLA